MMRESKFPSYINKEESKLPRAVQQVKGNIFVSSDIINLNRFLEILEPYYNS
jgi:hypothetical protein